MNMLTIQPWMILIPYAAVGAVMAFLGFMNVVNLLRFGARNWIGFLATFIFISGAAFVVFFGYQAMPQIDWTASVNVFSLTAAPF